MMKDADAVSELKALESIQDADVISDFAKAFDNWDHGVITQIFSALVNRLYYVIKHTK